MPELTTDPLSAPTDTETPPVPGSGIYLLDEVAWFDALGPAAAMGRTLATG